MKFDTNRRQLLLAGGVAVAGTAAGGWWWQHGMPGKLDQAMADALWAYECPTLTGDTLTMRQFQGRPLVVNFWATWCPPCVAEMPLLDSFYRQNSSSDWQVVGLAIDQPSQVRQFLMQRPVSYPIGLAAFQGSDLLRTLGNEGGGLPFTLVLDAKGRVIQSKLGKLTEDDVKKWADKTI